jgi:hypothetical protein
MKKPFIPSDKQLNEILANISANWTAEKDKEINKATHRVNCSNAKFGTKVDDSVRLTMSLKHKGKPRSAEIKKKISAALKGREVTNETRLKISIGNKGKTIPLETRIKISKGLTGGKRSIESKEKMSLLAKNRKPTVKTTAHVLKLIEAKKIAVIVDNIRYSSMSEVAIKYNITVAAVRNRLRNNRNNFPNWKYADKK